MLFIVTRECLLKLFKFAAFVAVEKKQGGNVIGAHVLLVVKDNQIQLIATDLDVELIVKENLYTSEITEGGEVVVPFRKLNDICRAMVDNTSIKVSITGSLNNKFSLQTEQGCFAVNCLSPNLFPVLEDKRFDEEFLLGAQLLRELISKVIFAVGDDDGRHFLNGVCLHIGKDNILAVSADGHRLMVWEPGVHPESMFTAEGSVNLLIPKKSSLDILKILSDIEPESTIKIYLGKNHFRMMVNNIVYTSKLLAAPFPSFKKLIPQHLTNTLTISKESLKSSLMRAAALLGDREQGVKLIFGGNSLQVVGSNDQEDSVTESIPATFVGEKTQICFNLKYLLDFLSHIDTDTIIFKVADPMSGALLQDVSLKGSYVLMPMQI